MAQAIAWFALESAEYSLQECRTPGPVSVCACQCLGLLNVLYRSHPTTQAWSHVYPDSDIKMRLHGRLRLTEALE
jgi:hypothetical protein